MINFVFNNMAAYLLVFVRMTGMIAFNPLLSRRNVPSRVRAGLIVCLTILLAPVVDASPAMDYTAFDFVFASMRELFVGFVCAYIFQVFYYMLFFAGDMMDMQMGLSMAKVFDPGTNIQMSATGNLMSLMFILFIFVTDSHLLLIKIFATSYDIIPLGAAGITLNGVEFVITVFVSAFSLALRLTLPFIATELVVEASMGVLMKLIPQIHVFVINIQIKLLLGLSMLLAFSHPISEFIDRYADTLFINIERALFALAG